MVGTLAYKPKTWVQFHLLGAPAAASVLLLLLMLMLTAWLVVVICVRYNHA